MNDLKNETVEKPKCEDCGSLITADTVISGDINSTSAVKIMGEVKGNVTSTKGVEVHGRVVGDISGECVCLFSGTVNGNVTSRSIVRVDKEVVLVGDVKAVDVEASGKIKGKVEVGNLITLENSAVCEGSITAALINIKTGAKIKGPITVYEIDAKDFKEAKKPTTKSRKNAAKPKTKVR